MLYIDRENSFSSDSGGKSCHNLGDKAKGCTTPTNVMWEVDHIKQHKGMAMFAYTKIGTYAVAPPEDMFVLSSPNLLTEQDPSKVRATGCALLLRCTVLSDAQKPCLPVLPACPFVLLTEDVLN